MTPTCCIFVLSKIVMLSRGPKCLKINYSRVEDRLLPRNLWIYSEVVPGPKTYLNVW